MSRESSLVDLRCEIERIAAAVRGEEALMRFEQEHVTGFEHDVADATDDPLTAAMHRDDRGVVDGAELTLADGAADETRGRGDDRFDHSSNRGWCIHLARLRVLALETGEPTELADTAGRADEAERVVRFEHFVGTDRAESSSIPFDRGEEEVGQVSKAGLFDGTADQRTVRDHLEPRLVPFRILGGLDLSSIRQQHRREHDHREESEHGGDHAGDADREESPRPFERPRVGNHRAVRGPGRDLVCV